MHGRKMNSGDFARLRALAEARPEFVLPDLGSSNILAKRVVETPAGGNENLIIAGAAARLTTEIHLFVDPCWESPRWRLEAIRFLQREMRTELREKGITEGIAWVTDPRWGQRLINDLGWDKCKGEALVFSV